MKKNTIYLKLAQMTEVYKADVLLKDIAEIHCLNKELEQAAKTVRITTFLADNRKKRCRSVYVGDVMDIIGSLETMNEEVQIINLGETEFVVKYRSCIRDAKLYQWLKTILIGVISFCGAAFAIMTFNNDASVTDVFENLYYLITGVQSDGVTILEVSYSIGLAMGILIFFNHFASWKLTVDPTPIEVEMRLYETNVNKTLIQNDKRRERGTDVT